MRVRHGQRVRLNAPGSTYHGQTGKVRLIGPGSMDYNVKLRMDDGQDLWCPEEDLQALPNEETRGEA